MFTIFKYDEKIPLVILDEQLEEIVSFTDPTIKKMVAGWLEHGFPVRGRSIANNTLHSEEELTLQVEPQNIHIFQEFLQNIHALDIVQSN